MLQYKYHRIAPSKTGMWTESGFGSFPSSVLLIPFKQKQKKKTERGIPRYTYTYEGTTNRAVKKNRTFSPRLTISRTGAQLSSPNSRE